MDLSVQQFHRISNHLMLVPFIIAVMFALLAQQLFSSSAVIIGGSMSCLRYYNSLVIGVPVNSIKNGC